ncbi:PD-(D/E)XK nuclease family protein [Marinitoga lauensis]|uniref:PD-(D/E)XK nuclease family protein n=1 Tax=Marinitoga lauensis TaxID=2201189 RepID=UPI001011943B|nr:PD-(D/E)XK nuclease family protein [Marinitoga lauensis]
MRIELGKDFTRIFDINKFLEDTEALRLMYVAITRPKEMLIPIIKPQKNDSNNIKYYSDLFMKLNYEARDIISENDLDVQEIDLKNKEVKKETQINEKNLSDLTELAYKKYIAPTYIINELKKEENSDDLTEEGYVTIGEYDFFKEQEFLLKGTELHSLMESVNNFSQIQYLIKAGKLPEKLDNELIKRLFSYKKFKTEWRLVKRKVIENKEYMIFGVPDRVVFDENNNIEILDYKYSDLNNSKKIEDYKFQLQFYMYLLKDFENPIKGYIISLKNGKIIEVAYDENFEEKLVNRILLI